MAGPSTNAREMLLGADHATFPLTGAGTRILLLDAGISPGYDCGGRLTDLTEAQGAAAEPDAELTHALRITSVCAEGEEARDLPGGSLGIAPRAQLVRGLYGPLMPDRFHAFLNAAVAQCGRIDVIGLAWSAVEDYWLAHEGRAAFSAVADADPDISAVTIAAVGHDGPRRVRFPASCETVIGVGVGGPDLLPTPYCGVDPDARKPELLVPAGDYLARGPDGALARINGTSAAVAIVTGLAALWCERLRSASLAPTPPLVRAALLAASELAASPAHRLAAADGCLRGEVPFVAVERSSDDPLPYRATLVSAVSGTVRIAASVRGHPRPGRWMPQKPEITIMAGNAAGRTTASGRHWCLLEVNAVAGERLTVTIDVDGGFQSLALVAIGVSPATEPEPVRTRATRHPLTIVGISASHDASACVLRGNRVEAAVQLERLTRVKHDGAGYLHSREAVDYCLQSLGITEKEVDLFAFNSQPLLPGWTGLSQPYADQDFDLFDPFGERSFFVSHHLAHAFAGFFASPFDDAAVFVCDGSGGATLGADDLMLTGPELARYLTLAPDRLPLLHVQSTYTFEPGGFRLVDRELAPSFNTRSGSSSLGETYAAVSQYIFGDWREGGKLMGLAPYGDPAACDRSFLARGEDGRLQFRSDWKNRHRAAVRRRPPLDYRHLAARVQRDLEEALLERVRRVLALTGQRRLVFTGGVALNSVANDRIRRETGVEKLFLFPAGHDAGCAVGAAAAAWFHRTGSLTGRVAWQHDFLGHPYGADDYRLAIGQYGAYLHTDSLNCGILADRIVDGWAVGWFEGASEFGPRALGHRSIIADARQRETWQRLNAKVKYREDFRPLAPIVPVELASRYFELDEPSPYMLRVVKVREEYRERLGAVCHVDGTARVQTVDRHLLPNLYDLLHEVGRRTGLPVLVNTSLNRRGEPVIEDPLDAIAMLLTTDLDALVMGPHLLVPRRPEGGELCSETPVALSPGTRVVCESSPQGPVGRIESAVRGKQGYQVPLWCAAVLMEADGHTPLGRLLERYMPSQVSVETSLSFLTTLYRDQLLMVADWPC